VLSAVVVVALLFLKSGVIASAGKQRQTHWHGSDSASSSVSWGLQPSSEVLQFIQL